MVYQVNLEKDELVDIVLLSEYFASLCHFEYPIGELDQTKELGYLDLIAQTTQSSTKDKSIQGLMVWRNKSYLPKIKFIKDGEVVFIGISNQKELPYPIIERTNAWLNGLIYYLENKNNNKRVTDTEKKAKEIYKRRISDLIIK